MVDQFSGVLDDRRDQADFAGTYVVLRAMLGLIGYAFAVLFVLVFDYPDIVVRAVAIAGLGLVQAHLHGAHARSIRPGTGTGRPPRDRPVRRS